MEAARYAIARMIIRAYDSVGKRKYARMLARAYLAHRYPSWTKDQCFLTVSALSDFSDKKGPWDEDDKQGIPMVCMYLSLEPFNIFVPYNALSRFVELLHELKQ